MTATVDSTTAYVDVVLGTRVGFLAIAYGHDPYYDERGRYRHRLWTERRYPWPEGWQTLRTDVSQILAAGERADVYVCPAVRFTDDRRKGSALPPMVCWVDLDGPVLNEVLLSTLDPLTVRSGSDSHRHGYLPLTRPVDLGTHAWLNRALAQALGADAKWSDEALLRLPGTPNHKTDPPTVVTPLPWSGRVWEPTELAGLLGVDLTAAGGPASRASTAAAATAEPVPDPLPALVRWALDHPDTADRSAAHHRLVSACHDAGLTRGQTITVAAGYPPSREKYGDRLAAEVDRSWLAVDAAGPVPHKSPTEQLYDLIEQPGSAEQRSPDAEHADDPRHTAGAADDTDFFAARPVLSHIKDFALARRASPWAVLGVVLVRVIACIPPRVVLPPLVGDVASLNLFIALVGPSGSGKGAATSVATQALTLGDPSACNFGTHTLGSGQGIAHAYMHWDSELKKPVRGAESAVFIIEEIDHLVGLTKQTSSTLLPELRRLYMAERLGHLYVDPTKRIEIPAHTYRAGLVAGVQPARARVLLDDADGGTPQRFVWLPTIYPAHPDIRPDPPASPWRWNPPRWPDPVAAAGRMLVTLPVAQAAAAEIDAATLARARGQGDPLDGHRLLCQEKVAAALGILDGRAEVSEEDWQLAGRLLAVSDATRATIIQELTAQTTERNTARAKAEAARAVIIADVVEREATARVAKSILRILERAAGWMTRTELRTRLASRDRGRFDPVVSHLIAVGQVIQEPTERGTRYRPAEHTP